MKIYESAVRKPISTILLFVGVMVFGLFSLMNLAVDQYPEIEIPQISVITMYPGANAADIETNITRVLEDNLNKVSNLKKPTKSATWCRACSRSCPTTSTIRRSSSSRPR